MAKQHNSEKRCIVLKHDHVLDVVFVGPIKDL